MGGKQSGRRDAGTPLAGHGTEDVDTYVLQAAVFRRSVSDQAAISISRATQAHAEARFHLECLRRWRRTLNEMARKPKSGSLQMGRVSKVPALLDDPEAALEMARRHVREAELRVSRQREIVAGLPTGELRQVAEDLLAEFEKTLRDQVIFLHRLETETDT